MHIRRCEIKDQDNFEKTSVEIEGETKGHNFRDQKQLAILISKEWNQLNTHQKN